MTFSQNDENGCTSISSETPSCVNITQRITVDMSNIEHVGDSRSHI